MKTLILAAVAAATLVTAAPAAMAQPYGYYHHFHRHFGPGYGYGPGYGPGFRRPFYGRRRFCNYHPYRC